MITQEKIAKRAYEIWLSRGGQHGSHVDDWVQAEAELQKELRQSAPITPCKMTEAVSQTLAKRKVTPAKPVKSTRGRASGLKTA